MTITRRKLCKWNRMRGKSYLHLAKNNVKCRNGRRGNHVRYINEIRLMKKKAWAFRDSAWRDRGKKCGFSKNWAEAEFLDCPTTGINNYVVKIRRAEFIGVSLTWPQSHTFFSSFSSSFLFSFFSFRTFPSFLNFDDTRVFVRIAKDERSNEQSDNRGRTNRQRTGESGLITVFQA